MYYSLVVIDDFSDAVDALREKALQAVYPMPEEQTFFQVEMLKKRLYVDGLDPLISEIVGKKLVAAIVMESFVWHLQVSKVKVGATLTNVTGRGS